MRRCLRPLLLIRSRCRDARGPTRRDVRQDIPPATGRSRRPPGSPAGRSARHAPRAARAVNSPMHRPARRGQAPVSVGAVAAPAPRRRRAQQRPRAVRADAAPARPSSAARCACSALSIAAAPTVIAAASEARAMASASSIRSSSSATAGGGRACAGSSHSCAVALAVVHTANLRPAEAGNPNARSTSRSVEMCRPQPNRPEEQLEKPQRLLPAAGDRRARAAARDPGHARRG